MVIYFNKLKQRKNRVYTAQIYTYETLSATHNQFIVYGGHSLRTARIRGKERLERIVKDRPNLGLARVVIYEWIPKGACGVETFYLGNSKGQNHEKI